MKRYLFILIPVLLAFGAAVADTFVQSSTTMNQSGPIDFYFGSTVKEVYDIDNVRPVMYVGSSTNPAFVLPNSDVVAHAFIGSGTGLTAVVGSVLTGGATTNFVVDGYTLYFTNGTLRRTSIP